MKEKPSSAESGEKLPSLKQRSRSNSGDADTQMKLVASEQRELKLRELLLTNQDLVKRLREVAVSILSALDESCCGYSIALDFVKEQAHTLAKLGAAVNPLKCANLSSNPPVVASPSMRSKRNSLSRPGQFITGSQILAPLDFMKIKDALTRADSLSKAYLLQALRWRVTQSQHGTPRKRVVQSYVNANIFSIPLSGSVTGPTSMNSTSGKDLIHLLMRDQSPSVREEVVRLLNIMASEFSGRGYLAKGSTIVEILALMKKETNDSVSRQNCIGSLQKLSLNRTLQSQMIQAGVIQAIVDVLRDLDAIGEYSLEYGCALLMNLSLRYAGRVLCESLDILEPLADLIEDEDAQIREYIHGTLYSILKRPILREKAKAMGLEEILSKAAESSTPPIRKQIDFVLKQLSSDEPDEIESAAGEDDEEDEDYHDEDEEVDDHDESYESLESNSEVQGEKLLCSRFLLSNEGAKAQVEEVNASIDAIEKAKMRKSINKSVANRSPQDARQGQVGFSPYAYTSPPNGPLTSTDQSPSSSRLPSSIRLQSELKRGVSIQAAHPDEIMEYESAFGTKARLSRTPIRGERRGVVPDIRAAEESQNIDGASSQSGSLSARDAFVKSSIETRPEDGAINKGKKSIVHKQFLVDTVIYSFSCIALFASPSSLFFSNSLSSCLHTASKPTTSRPPSYKRPGQEKRL
eukprot:TRINITY_DN2731_c0_g1_i13.p1 TRINITY_DN2731_c0_g1~~TRINITY_DN2731_c0_g1_i13.p1  ORF type:complete len:692 (-),score=132.86 TRINITY_DN2731_c0_g1_i13:1455-3530(-)